jgi:hypothetical protein
VQGKQQKPRAQSPRTLPRMSYMERMSPRLKKAKLWRCNVSTSLGIKEWSGIEGVVRGMEKRVKE